MDELLTVFRQESVELIDRLAHLVDALDDAPSKQREAIVIDALRVAHNLKGVSFTVGHDSLGNAAHDLEDRLSGLKDNAVLLTGSRRTELQESISKLYQLADGDLPETPPPEAPAESLTPPLAQSASSPSPSGPETSIRVDTRRLDELRSHTGELLVTRSKLLEGYRELDQVQQELQSQARSQGLSRDSVTALSERMAKALRRQWQDILAFGHLSADINDAMKRVRMMPIAGLESLLRRTVRETAQELGKQVTLSTDLGGIEVDKYLLDQLRDPLMHILRNAVAHGIESPAKRAAMGKPERGRVQVVATMQGTQVRIEISDDGMGLDVEHIAGVALARRLVEEETLMRLGDAEILDLLFYPTFSTATDVDRTSGRGVGLSVAKTRMEQIGGSVYIPTEAVLGGTTFCLTSPVSVVSVAGLLVREGQQIYTLALDEVSRIFATRLSQVQSVDGVPLIRLDDGDPMRVLQLGELVGAAKTDSTTPLKLIELTRAEERLGLMVSDVLGEKELVIKPLPWNVELVSHINGATVLDDGSVALALDVASLFNAASQTTDVVSVTEVESAGGPPRVLVTDDSLTSRTLGRNVLSAAGYSVKDAVDGDDAWRQLQQEHFDLLVSDINMPRMDGYELTRAVRGSNILGDLPVVLVSSLGSRADMERGIAAGANEYVVKGQYEHTQLLEAVNRLLQS